MIEAQRGPYLIDIDQNRTLVEFYKDRSVTIQKSGNHEGDDSVLLSFARDADDIGLFHTIGHELKLGRSFTRIGLSKKALKALKICLDEYFETNDIEVEEENYPRTEGLTEG